MFAYYVSATIGDAELGNLPIFKIVSPEINEVKLRSKPYDGYKDCIDQAQKFITDIAVQLNQAGGSYFVQTGHNPDFGEDGEEQQDTGVPGVGLLGNWHPNELCRYYLMSNSGKDKSGVFLTKLIVSILTQQPTKKGN